MHKSEKKEIFWDSVAIKSMAKPFLIDIFGIYKKEELKKLIYEWIGETNNLNILKTDLYEEGIGNDHVLFDMFKKDKVFGVDISNVVVSMACLRSKELERDLRCTVGDVTELPYRDNSFDLIISNSTLDQLKKNEISKAISELKRVLKNDGRIVLTINNKHNIFFYVISRIGILLKIIPFPVEFYSREEMSRIFDKHDLKIKDLTAIIHLLSGVNRFLLISYRLLGPQLTDAIAKPFLFFADEFSKKKTRYFSGWFLAYLLSKE